MQGKKTAFTVPGECRFEFTRMPFGLKNAPATFQRTMETVLRELIGTICFVYLDDVIIFGRSFKEHLDNLERVLKRLGEVGLKIKLSKWQFIMAEAKHLGHIVSSEGVRPNPAKILAIQNFPVPKNIHQLRGFIPQFAQKAKPLTALIKLKTPYKWAADQEAGFLYLKNSLISEPLLKYPNFEQPFILTTDASGFAMGAILSQKIKGECFPIAYASQQLNPAEQNYSATERECLSVVWAVKHFHCYLYGHRFQVITQSPTLQMVNEC